jgi:hypothetical protein
LGTVADNVFSIDKKRFALCVFFLGRFENVSEQQFFLRTSLFTNTFRILPPRTIIKEAYMIVSFAFIFHLLGFGLITTSLLAGWILERRIRKVSDWNQKLLLLSASRSIGLLSPIASFIMLITGIANIVNVFGTSFSVVYSVGWLAAKIILFAFMLVNGAIFGPILSRKRTKLIQSIVAQSAPADAEDTVIVYSKNLSTFYFVQTLLLLIILFLSVWGTGKHAGVI